MRRFDGVQAPASAQPKAAPSRWGWQRNPQYGLAMSVAVIALIGLPAALIVIRDTNVDPAEVAEAPAADVRARSPSVAAENKPAPEAEPVAIADGVIPGPRPQPDRRSPLSDEAPTESAAKASADYASPLPAVTAPSAPPPPAPPPPAPAAEADSVAEDSQIVVTGSRIEQATNWTERQRDGRGKARSAGRAAEVVATAPGWVLSDRAYDTFLRRLQSAIRADNRAAVTGMIAYPLRVNRNGGSTSYANGRAVLADYELIFTARVKSAILNQRFERLFGRDQGVAIGDGVVWFDHSCRTSACSPPGPVRIKAINP